MSKQSVEKVNEILTDFQVQIVRWCNQDIKDSRTAYYKTREALIKWAKDEYGKEN